MTPKALPGATSLSSTTRKDSAAIRTVATTSPSVRGGADGSSNGDSKPARINIRGLRPRPISPDRQQDSMLGCGARAVNPPVALVDWNVVDAGLTAGHEPVAGELP